MQWFLYTVICYRADIFCTIFVKTRISTSCLRYVIQIPLAFPRTYISFVYITTVYITINQQDAAVRSQFYFSAGLLYMFRVLSTPIIRST